jgi:hypothetical protein
LALHVGGEVGQVAKHLLGWLVELEMVDVQVDVSMPDVVCPWLRWSVGVDESGLGQVRGRGVGEQLVEIWVEASLSADDDRSAGEPRARVGA